MILWEVERLYDMKFLFFLCVDKHHVSVTLFLILFLVFMIPFIFASLFLRISISFLLFYRYTIVWCQQACTLSSHYHIIVAECLVRMLLYTTFYL